MWTTKKKKKKKKKEANYPGSDQFETEGLDWQDLYRGPRNIAAH